MVNEVVDMVKQRNDECLLFKVDFEKTYDFVAGGFFDLHDAPYGF